MSDVVGAIKGGSTNVKIARITLPHIRTTGDVVSHYTVTHPSLDMVQLSPVQDTRDDRE